MKRLDYARKRARELRMLIGLAPDGLQTRLEKYLTTTHKVSPCAVDTDSLRGSIAEVMPKRRQLRYDKTLDDKPLEKLFIFAHELGHLTLHQRSIGLHAMPNRLRSSKYARSDGVGALARYNKRDAEEVEANAFAKEFLCPADLLLADWQAYPDATIARLAEQWGVEEEIIQIQLAESLFDLVFNNDAAKPADLPRAIELNDEQHNAATYLEGTTLVDAGPGTGKTATLVMRVEHLLRQEGTLPNQILILTFSNEAADELRERIEQRFDEETARAIEIHTFHSFGHSCLLSHALKLDEDYSILDEVAQEELMVELLGRSECDAVIALHDPGETARLAVEQINFLKDRMLSTENLALAVAAMPAADARAKQKAAQLLELWRNYEEQKTQLQTVDFADLILLTLRTLQDNDALTRELQAQYQHVLVDEFQDVSVAMIGLLKLLCGEQNPPWVVGDIRQAIYRFRGADPIRNVTLFKELYPAAKPFDLRHNYRSSSPIIKAANQMATLLATPEHQNNNYHPFWLAGAEHPSFGESPVQILAATSDASEQNGIAELVAAWQAAKIPLHDIAILARRNIDVRNIVLALGARKIKATTSGLITPEGPAGDLAAVLTLADMPVAPLPRVIYALGRGRYAPAVLNAVIGLLLNEEKDKGQMQLDEGASLIAEYRKLLACLQQQQHRNDAFGQLCAFLFDGSDYLRRILSDADQTLRSLALSEIITTLTRAAAYRFAHQRQAPHTTRIGFAQHFRDNLSQSKPVTAAPRSHDDAVRVMTCHASKGLEFPCVIVAGQTLNSKKPSWWLPPSLSLLGEEERKQADSLLFVGVTRAQRTAVITFAKAKTTKGRQRELPKLLDRWQTCYAIPSSNLPEHNSEKSVITTKALWGQRTQPSLPVRHLDKSVCGVATYLEKFVGARFPSALSALYPTFTVAVRRALRQIVVQAQCEQHVIAATQAEVIFLHEFERLRSARFQHPHQNLYERIGISFSRRFATAYQPHPGKVEFLHWSQEAEELRFEPETSLLPLRLDLVACFRDAQGVLHALLYHRKSLSTDNLRALNWSAIKDPSKRVSFVILHKHYPAIRFLAFSGEDGRLYQINPNRVAGNMDEEAAQAIQTLRGFSEGCFTAQADDYRCDRCAVRIACPHWLQAISAD